MSYKKIMLLEARFVLSFYFGVRIFENKNKNIKKPKNEIAVRKNELYHENRLIKESQKDLEHNFNMSIANLGIAAIRQFIYPPIASLLIGFFIDNNFKLYRCACVEIGI